jgi:hypothetical protein
MMEYQHNRLFTKKYDDSSVYFVSADNGRYDCKWRIARDDGKDTSQNRSCFAAGMIDEKTNQWPDIDKITGKCKRKIKVEEVELTKNNFSLITIINYRLLASIISHGCISIYVYSFFGLSNPEA